jgi:NAD+ kinase
MPVKKTPKISFVAADTPHAQEARKQLIREMGNVALAKADVVVALGGDGLMLHSLHRIMGRRVPIFGMNVGTVGFLMNEFRASGLKQRLQVAEEVTLHPLRMKARTNGGGRPSALAVNEVSLFRMTSQIAKLRISVDGVVRLDELLCDGILVSTAAGSTAYNLSAHGPILPLGSNLLALTPINPFRPRRWRGAILPHDADFRIEVLESDKRPVSVTADNKEVRDITQVQIAEASGKEVELLFDPEHNLEERILREQFLG